MAACNDPVPNLRAVVALSREEVTILRAAGLRSLPAAHELRDIACWARLSWRPAVRVHALRALVRSPAALASLSARAQDMLFAVFRTINASNRDVAAQIFGVLLLAEDPWLIDAGGDGADGDAQRSIDAFLRLYDARHQFLGDASATAGAFADPELLHRESDAMRRHLHHPVPHAPESAPKTRRISAAASRAQGAGAGSEAGSATGMRGMSMFAGSSSDGGDDRAELEVRVADLTREVESMKEQLRENERRIANLHSTFDYLAKVLLDEFATSTCVLPQIVAPMRPPNAASPARQTMDVENPSAHTASNGGTGSPQLTTAPHSTSVPDPSAGKPPSGLRDNGHAVPALPSPEQQRVRKPAVPRSGYVAPYSTPATPAGAVEGGAKRGDPEQRRRLLESFRSVMEATPWSAFLDNNRQSSSVSAENAGGADVAALAARRGPVLVFRDGRWVERNG